MSAFLGVHAVLFSHKADEVRAFLKDVLELESVDAGHGWLIFGLPPAELAVHPDEGPARSELYLMCHDVEATARALAAKGVKLSQPISDQRWGRLAAIRLPDGSDLGIYEPAHPTAIQPS